MVNGLISQLITKVRITGLGVLAAFTAWEKSIFTMMGYIMKKDRWQWELKHCKRSDYLKFELHQEKFSLEQCQQ